jgi:hypothetical protein
VWWAPTEETVVAQGHVSTKQNTIVKSFQFVPAALLTHTTSEKYFVTLVT